MWVQVTALAGNRGMQLLRWESSLDPWYYLLLNRLSLFLEPVADVAAPL